ncbi:MAG: DUF5674 family protein [Nitrospira sp.]|nr:DUF5674 family protein [Nitrospira sp.]
MQISIVRTTVTKAALSTMATQQFGDMVKAVVDVEQGIMAIGVELHSDEEAVLLEQGSLQKHLWGINIYPERLPSEWIEFDDQCAPVRRKPFSVRRACGDQGHSHSHRQSIGAGLRA